MIEITINIVIDPLIFEFRSFIIEFINATNNKNNVGIYKFVKNLRLFL